MIKKIIIAVCIITGAYSNTPLYANNVLRTITIHDDAGRKVSVQLPVKRVITLAPSNSELVSAIGMTSAIVGASSTDDTPLPKDVKRIGSIDPSIEVIVSLKPDLVMGIYGENIICSRLERLHIPCVILSARSIDGVIRDVKLTGKIFLTTDAANVVIRKMKNKLDRINSRLKHSKTTPLVYFEIDASDPSRPFSAGGGSLIDSMITKAHAVNIAHTIKNKWPRLSSEYIIAKNPDIIILSDRLNINALKKRQGWSDMKAIKTGRVYNVNPNLVSRPDPDIVNGFLEIARAIHPEVFKKTGNGKKN